MLQLNPFFLTYWHDQACDVCYLLRYHNFDVLILVYGKSFSVALEVVHNCCCSVIGP